MLTREGSRLAGLLLAATAGVGQANVVVGAPRTEPLTGLHEVASQASDVVIGVALPSRFGSLRPAGAGAPAERLFKLEVTRVLSGPLVEGAVITIGRPYASAEVTRASAGEGVRQLGPELRYLLMLRGAADRNGYVIVGDAAGAFEIRGDAVIPCDRRPSAGAWRVDSALSLERFLTAMRGAGARR